MVSSATVQKNGATGDVRARRPGNHFWGLEGDVIEGFFTSTMSNQVFVLGRGCIPRILKHWTTCSEAIGSTNLASNPHKPRNIGGLKLQIQKHVARIAVIFGWKYEVSDPTLSVALCMVASSNLVLHWNFKRPKHRMQKIT